MDAKCKIAALGALTFRVLIVGGVGQQGRRENMHAVLVEETQKLCLLSFLGEKKEDLRTCTPHNNDIIIGQSCTPL